MTTNATAQAIPPLKVLSEEQRNLAQFFLSFHILDKESIPTRHKIGWASYVARTAGPWHEGYEICGVGIERGAYVVQLRTGGAYIVSFKAIENAARLVDPKVLHGLRFFPAKERGRVTFDHLSLNTDPKLVGDDYRCNGISNQSYWRRDVATLKILGRCILPNWKLDRPMNVASVGCSIGIEPTMLLLLNWEQRHRLRLSGYEIHYPALDEAREGKFEVYTGSTISDMRFFDDIPPKTQSEALQWEPIGSDEQLLRLTPQAQNAIAYAQLDILAEPLPMLFDVIYLRYVMMHFNRAGKIECINNILRSLQPGGVVILNSPQDGKDGEETRIKTIRLFEKAGFVNHRFAEIGGDFLWYDGVLALRKPE